MPTKNQKINYDIIGEPCVKCCRPITKEVVDEFLSKRKSRNKELIKNALEATNKNKRKSDINLSVALTLYQRGFTYREIGIECAKLIKRKKPFTATAVCEVLKDKVKDL